MHIALLRHGRAADRQVWTGNDADRPLTKEGIARCRLLLKCFSPLVTCDQVWTSPLLRTRQTAELVATNWRLPVRELPELAPGAADSQQRLQLLQRLGARAPMLVGHEPDLSELALALSGARMPMRKGGLIVLEGDPVAHGMTVHCVLAPRHVFAITANASELAERS